MQSILLCCKKLAMRAIDSTILDGGNTHKHHSMSVECTKTRSMLTQRQLSPLVQKPRLSENMASTISSVASLRKEYQFLRHSENQHKNYKPQNLPETPVTPYWRCFMQILVIRRTLYLILFLQQQLNRFWHHCFCFFSLHIQ